MLDAFFSFAASFTRLIHFNGNNFDLPYLLQKCQQHNLPHNFDKFEGIDLYKRISPYKAFLHVPNCKQKTLENLLGIHREDRFNGGDLIEVYCHYVENPSKDARSLLLLHNSDDMKGMLQILPLLAFYDLFNGDIRAKKVQANSYIDYNGQDRQELLMKLHLSTALPIPQEDFALHKSVASFVDKSRRLQASAATCYTRKYGLFLPQWDIFIEPFFKRDYKSKEYFFELTDERKTDRALFSRYAQYLLGKMARTY